jgi:hypothetical protein
VGAAAVIRPALFLLLPALLAQPDWRDIRSGSPIPAEGYADQPYVVKAADGAWVCVLTTGSGQEGAPGQHVVALRSRDFGKTWEPPVDVEPAGGPEASWAVPLVTPSGRIYVLYTYNRDNVREVPDAQSPGIARRVDTLGVFALKYSDDHGRTWSRRFEVPQRKLPTDAGNNFGGRQIFFWSVGKPVADRGQVFIGFARISRWGVPGVLVRSRGFLLRSDNVLTESDPARIRWEMLPDSDEGLTAPEGPIAEETNITALSDGTLYAVYRTIDGYLCHSYSGDRGRTWTPPAYATYGDGRPIKNPRAFTFARHFSNGRYLLWFHNHGGEAAHLNPRWDSYRDRNPGWISGGVERDGRIHWSPPEPLLYDSDPATRISYPDFIEDQGRFFITETQKSVARTHEIPRAFLDTLWDGAAPSRRVSGAQLVSAAPLSLPELIAGKGFTLEFRMRLQELSWDQTLLDTRDQAGRGLLLTTGDHFNLRLTLSDGKTTSSFESDPGTHPGTLRVNHWHHVSVIVDAGPRLIRWVIDGIANDGGPVRQFGWGRFSPLITGVNSAAAPRLAPRVFGEIRDLLVYPRALVTTEAVANFRALQPIP